MRGQDSLFISEKPRMTDRAFTTYTFTHPSPGGEKDVFSSLLGGSGVVVFIINSHNCSVSGNFILIQTLLMLLQ